MIRYLGSKKKLIETIFKAVDVFYETENFFDCFAGTSVVGAHAKRLGMRVTTCDLNYFNYQIARCYIKSNKQVYQDTAEDLIKHLNHVKPIRGFITENYAIGTRFFSKKNAMMIDAWRTELENLDIDDNLRSIGITAVLEASDKVNSCGAIQRSYIKVPMDRVDQKIELKTPKLIESEHDHEIYNADVNTIAKKIKSDLAYIDPPYNHEEYLSGYHLNETIARYDNPEVYGAARKRADCKVTKSAYNDPNLHKFSLTSLIQDLNTKVIMLSMNNNGFIKENDLIRLLNSFGPLIVIPNELPKFNSHAKDIEIRQTVDKNVNDSLYVIFRDYKIFERSRVDYILSIFPQSKFYMQ